MDCAAHRVEKDGIPVELTAKEYAILELLLRNPRRVYTKAQLLCRGVGLGVSGR